MFFTVYGKKFFWPPALYIYIMDLNESETFELIAIIVHVTYQRTESVVLNYYIFIALDCKFKILKAGAKHFYLGF